MRLWGHLMLRCPGCVFGIEPRFHWMVYPARSIWLSVSPWVVALFDFQRIKLRLELPIDEIYAPRVKIR